MLPKKRKASPPSEARERILRTAQDLFYRYGVRATGVDRIIAESGVAKLTFYRHFATKNDLVRAYLDRRHEEWMAWFSDALIRHGGGASAVVLAIEEWLRDPAYRGCAFINSVVELADMLPDMSQIAQRHKSAMGGAIAAVLAKSPQRTKLAQALAVVIDGVIVRAQCDGSPEEALAALKWIVKAFPAG
ncbi:MAG: TetR/AcrR family transcriptional regulator [Acidiferrobacteraceae bacterium]